MKKFILVVEQDVISVITIASREKFTDITNACLNGPVFVELPIDCSTAFCGNDPGQQCCFYIGGDCVAC